MTEIGLTVEDREIYHGLGEVAQAAGHIDYIANRKLGAQLPALGLFASDPRTVVELVTYRIEDSARYNTQGAQSAVY